MSKSEKEFNDLACEYCTTTREYFYILRLAIYHIDGVATETSVDVAKYEKSPEVYACAVKILKAMGERRKH